MKKWLRLLWFLPLVLIIPLVNIVGDPAGIYRNDSIKIAESIIEGNNTRFGSGNCNERRVKAKVIEEMPSKVDSIVVGPSTAVNIGNEILKEENTYNLGLSSADLYDIMAQFGLLEINEKDFDRVVFCVDNYFFDDVLNAGFTHHDELKSYAMYMIDTIEGKESNLPSKNKWAPFKSAMSQLFSVTYFQSAVDVIKANSLFDLLFRTDWSVNPSEYADSYFRPDASKAQSVMAKNASLEEVYKHAENYDLDLSFSNGIRPSEYSKKVFEELIVYLLKEGVDVDLYLSPFSPALYERIDAEKYPLVSEVEDFAKSMAEKYSLDLIGSYDPKAVGIGNECFVDGRHIKEEYLTEYFDFERK